MKVIDLLNKIAKGEEVPEFIEYENYFTKENEILLTHTDNIFHCLDNKELTLNSIISAVEDKEEEKEDAFTGCKWFDKGKEVMSMEYPEYPIEAPEEEKDIEPLNKMFYWNEDYELSEKNYQENGRRTAKQFQDISNKVDELIKAVNKLREGK